MKNKWFMSMLGLMLGLFSAKGILFANEHGSRSSPVEMTLLETLIHSKGEQEFGRMLKIYGPIRGQDLGTLTEHLSSNDEDVKRNAIRLISMARSPKVESTLKGLVLYSNDLYVTMFSMLWFLEGKKSTARFLIEKREFMVKKAIDSQDSQIHSMGLRLGAFLGLPILDQKLMDGLSGKDEELREAVLTILIEHPRKSLEPLLKKALLSDSARFEYNRLTLYRILSLSDDPTVAQVFRTSLEKDPTSRRIDFSNGIFLSHSRKRWLKVLLLEFVNQSGPLQSIALNRLKDWDDSTLREMKQLCRHLFASTGTELSNEMKSACIQVGKVP